MIKTLSKIDLEAFREREEQGLITCRSHPHFDLLIWNYTLKCTFEHAWDEVTLQARGLITRPDGTIVSRPFKKFFALGERSIDLPLEPFTVTDKLDGSLGISFQGDDGKYSISTRGSFVSTQAIRASKILHEKYPDFPFNPAYTYLYEIVFPENRYVVNYGDMEDLILLAVINTETGEEYNVQDFTVPTPVVRVYDGLTDVHALEQLEEDNREGFVVRFASGLRVKVKFAEYRRLFKIMTSTSNRTIWEYRKENKPLAEILERVPPEFEKWVRKVSRELEEKYLAIHRKIETVYKEVMATTSIDVPFAIDRTLSASQFKSLDTLMKKRIRERFEEYPDIAYFLLMKWDGCKYSYPDGRRETERKAALRLHIWDSLYPEFSRPFIIEGEDA